MAKRRLAPPRRYRAPHDSQKRVALKEQATA
jgi:hypothetical protein